MLLRVKYKPSKSDLNTTAPGKAMVKEVEHGWTLTLTIEFIRQIKDMGFLPLGVA